MLRIVAPKVTMLPGEVPKLAIVFNFWRAIKSFCHNHKCKSNGFLDVFVRHAKVLLNGGSFQKSEEIIVY